MILLLFWFLYLIRDIIVMLLAAIIIASAIEPLAKKLRRYRVPRGLSVVIVYLGVLAVVGAAVTLIVPPLVEQSVQLVQSLPEVVREVADRFGGSVVSDGLVPRIEESIAQFTNNLANLSLNIFQQTRDAFAAFLSFIFVFILAFYLVIEEDALKKFFRLVIPAEHVPYTERVIDRVQFKIGRWVLGQLALALVIGVVVGVGLWIIGVPHALALGLIAGVFEIIPVIGPVIAGVFGVLVALSHSVLLGIGTLIFYVVVQQLENHVLVPNIMKRATGLNPLVTLIAVLLGGRLAGTVGVILSVPVATMLSIFLSDFFAKTPPEELPG